MNKQLRKLAIGLMACYLALFAKLNWLQVIDASDLNNKPENGRTVVRDFNRPRGDIVTADGVIVAHSVPSEGRYRYQRTYPSGNLFAHSVGSYSLLFGSDGVERKYNDVLSGNTTEFRFRGFIDPFVEEPNVGTVSLTMRSDVQQAAKDALGEKPGSVVVLDPRTGAILAMWSYPSYDPNFTAINDATAARAFKEGLDKTPGKPLLARAFRDRYFPGSTFKVVTASAGLESGKVTETTPNFPPANGYQPPLTTRKIGNFDGATCGGVLFDLLRVSCNSGFAEMGSRLLGPDAMIDQAKRFGFDDTPPIDLPGAVSSVFPESFGKRLRAGANPGDADIYEGTPQLAQASIGQNDVSATPLEMAMVAGAIGNGGAMMTPHVMSEVRDRNGEVVDTYQPAVWKTPVSPTTAEVMKRGMVEVATKGTAKAMAIGGVEVGGKTGTAQLGTTPPKSHAWVIGFAGPAGQPAEVAVAVLVQGQPGASEQTGGKVAAPIAKKVLEVALKALPTGTSGR
ncbi:MAG: penicillin-binding protein 2 [Acidimicrobiales bacterium]